MTDLELDQLASNPRIIRHRGKIYATRTNASIFLKIQQEFGSFDSYLWAFVEFKPRQSHCIHLRDLPTTSPESIALSKDLRRRGMKFVGATIMYAYMQAVGMTNDHLTTCPLYKP
jgi:DNA-3-methyladenine glycosylase I